ncbi:MAG: tannase/feruloyl esterase family alpha/beta hydrolase [Acidobacteriota bacterium]
MTVGDDYNAVTMKRHLLAWPLATSLAVAFAASHQVPATTPTAATTAAAACAGLQNHQVAASAIGLPTSGATITSAVIVAASPQTVNAQGTAVVLAIPEYCQVIGAMAPIDPAAPKINFQINLPTEWNGKIMQLGGSGTNGVIPVALTTGMQWGPESIPPSSPYALARGFVTYGSDSGHQNPTPPAADPAARSAPAPPAWMTNDEALRNFLYAQMKKTHDVALEIVKLLYARPIRHSYYFGASQGGREALMVVQRYPQDYDGVFVQVPVFPYTYLTIFDSYSRAVSQAGDAWLPPGKVAVVAKEVRRQCDALDGLADGLVSNYAGCNTRFDPSITPHALDAVRCPGGKDTGETCLSDAQIAAANAVHGPVRFPFPLHNGWTSMPGWPTGSESAANWKTQAARTEPTTLISGNMALLIKDPGASMLSVELAKYQREIQAFSALADASDPDLSAFQRRGGKLVMKVNTTDYTANSRWSFAYYDRVVETMSQRTVDSFLRFYVAVGIFHNRNVGRNPLTNELVPSFADFIAMVDDWVEKGTAPADTQILTDMEPVPPFAVRSSLPMCRYPNYPHYRGAGDVKKAESYECRKP